MLVLLARKNDMVTTAGARWAAIAPGDLFATTPEQLVRAGDESQQIVVRAGLPEAESDDEPVIAWSPRVRAELADRLDAALDVADRAGKKILLWPDARDAVSDVPSTLGLLRGRERRLGLVLDPVQLLTGSMMPRAAEHVLRMVEALGGHEACAAVVVRDFGAGAGVWSGAVEAVRARAGAVVLPEDGAGAWARALGLDAGR